MNQVQKGLFALEEQMPCPPRSIGISHRYVLPSTLDKVEEEEAAARILSFSQELGQWVGVSWPRLIEMMKSDYRVHLNLMRARKHNLRERKRLRSAVRRYYLLCVITFGFYSLLTLKPVAKMKRIPDQKVPFSGIFLFGPEHVIAGIHGLVVKGMLRCVKKDGDKDGYDVFFPTPALVSRIMEKQGIKS